jgi:outer membrane lipoprotein-sorting protein
MKSKWTIFISLILLISFWSVGCNKAESTKEEVYKDFTNQISKMKSYSCIAEINVVGNKNPKEYVMQHNYTKPDNFKIKIISPDDLKGKIIMYDKEKIVIKNPNVDDYIELPNKVKDNQYLFIGDFIKNLFQNEELNMSLKGDYLILETTIQNSSKYFNKQVLYVDKESIKPTKLEIHDDEGKARFTVTYKNFKYNK